MDNNSSVIIENAGARYSNNTSYITLWVLMRTLMGRFENNADKTTILQRIPHDNRILNHVCIYIK